MHTVLVTATTLAAGGISLLEKSGCRILYAGNDAKLGRLLVAEKVDAVISRTLDLSGPQIASCPSLKVISKHGAGYDNIDVEAATRLGIPVFYTPGVNSQSLAELTFGLAIAVARKIPLHDRTLRSGGWSRAQTGLQLSGRTLGVVGLGNIGTKVAHLGAAFGMRVVGYDPLIKTAPCERVRSLEALLPQTQLLTLHCPLTKETRGMIGARELAMMPRDAIVLNTARGGIVDEKALADAIAAGHVFGAGIDAFESEPVVADHAFNRLGNVIMTPHIGAATREALDNVAIRAVENILAFLNQQPLDLAQCVNPATLHRLSTVST